MPKKLLLVGSNSSIAHVKSYYNLVKDYFDEVLVVTNVPIEYCEFKLVDFSLKNPFKVYTSIKRMRYIMKEFAPSIIHVHQAAAYSYITAKANLTQLPLVVTAWGSDVLILPHRNFMYRHIVKFSLRKADYLTADAHYMADEIKKMVNKEVLVANFGIENTEEEIPDKKKVIYSNRLHNPLYRVDQIIIGFAEFYKRNKEWKLIIGANGSETETLKKLASSLLPPTAYEFIGFVSQEINKQWYLDSKIWISYPESDGTAISLLEAMGYGCIPVTSDLPANREWIKEGENGQIVTNKIEKSMELAAQMNSTTVQNLNKNIILQQATKRVNKKKFETLYDSIFTVEK